MDNSNGLVAQLSRAGEHCLSSINSIGTDPAPRIRLQIKATRLSRGIYFGEEQS